jgi:hypothetical protein
VAKKNSSTTKTPANKYASAAWVFVNRRQG